MAGSGTAARAPREVERPHEGYPRADMTSAPVTATTPASAAAGDLSAEPVTVAMVTLGCARNEADSEELAGRREAEGFRLVDEPAEADTVVVNTCGFVEQAKKDSVDTLLEAADLKQT